MTEQQQWLTVPEAAALARVSLKTMYTLIGAGRIKGVVKVGRQFRIPPSFMDQMRSDDDPSTA